VAGLSAWVSLEDGVTLNIITPVKMPGLGSVVLLGSGLPGLAVLNCRKLSINGTPVGKAHALQNWVLEIRRRIPRLAVRRDTLT
jgi:hypothetical protein